eukprot:gene4004-20148_t
MFKDCQNGRTCEKCSMSKHHESLCKAANEPTGVIKTDKMAGPTAAVAYQTVIAKVQSVDGTKAVRCRVLLDSGSARSFITEKLAKKLGRRQTKKRVCQRFEGLNKYVQELKTASHVVQLTCLDGAYKDLMEVKTLPAITTVGNPSPLKLKKMYPHLQGIYFTDVATERQLEVDMLIGSEHLADIQTGHIIRGEARGPVTVKTRLGWTLMGPTGRSTSKYKKEPTILIIEDDHSGKDEFLRLQNSRGHDYNIPRDVAPQTVVNGNKKRLEGAIQKSFLSGAQQGTRGHAKMQQKTSYTPRKGHNQHNRRGSQSRRTCLTRGVCAGLGPSWRTVRPRTFWGGCPND